ncbi:glutamate--tRNA ligase [Candidatus Daviesbacteria bacterium]|nr:glutamate--tRNA ligase [Candidatus Daviesbacteria bacterium]
MIHVRYAPSPTGDPHVGNLHTALFNWLFVKHFGGKFTLRIDDTDTNRNVPDGLDKILDSLAYLGMDFNDGPFFASDSLDSHRYAADKLVNSDNAYYCNCTNDALRIAREFAVSNRKAYKYNNHCRDLGLRKTTDSVIRFKMPLDGVTKFHDMIYGDICFDNSLLEDFVIMKSNGYPTYHLATVIDDNRMNITHVMRANDWISSTPKHICIYNALDYVLPNFVHLPLILDKDRKKLSKRSGDATSILWYRDNGYYPDAMINFLALLGWSLDDKTTIISRADLIKYFSLDRVRKSSSIFDTNKLDWINKKYSNMR